MKPHVINGSMYQAYTVVVRSDRGEHVFNVYAKDTDSAKHQICKAERCPESAIVRVGPADTKMKIEVELTDTYGGEANYSWVQRATVICSVGTSTLAIVRRAKAAIGLNGVKCQREDYGDQIALRPYGQCKICFIKTADIGVQRGWVITDESCDVLGFEHPEAYQTADDVLHAYSRELDEPFSIYFRDSRGELHACADESRPGDFA